MGVINERVYLGVPTHDGRVGQGIVNALFGAGKTLDRVQIETGSSLTFNFNNCYAQALNARDGGYPGGGTPGKGITHFAMLHEDIAPIGNGWLDRMVEIANTAGADVLSVVMRLKTEDGKTSTAIEEEDKDNPRNPLGFKARKLTLEECYAKCGKDGGTWSEPGLLVNTGLMLVDIRKPWADKVWFEFKDWLGCVSTGNPGSDGQKVYFPVSLAEDYGFSRMVRREGGRIFATTQIGAIHCGGGRWSNVIVKKEG